MTFFEKTGVENSLKKSLAIPRLTGAAFNHNGNSDIMRAGASRHSIYIQRR